MKVRASVKKLCDKCKVIRRHGKVATRRPSKVDVERTSQTRLVHHRTADEGLKRTCQLFDGPRPSCEELAGGE